MLEAFVILGGIIIVLLAAGLLVASKDVGRKGNAGQPQRGYLFLSKPWG
ncbi:hypothetical protein [Amycolatopsis nivea]|nr:hypothetical protein [Amycolatopsis nivea]